MTAAELKYLIAIEALSDGGAGIKLTAIAERMGVTKVSAYRAAERLEKGGCIRRDEKSRVVLTEKGRAQLTEYRRLTDWLGRHLAQHCALSEEQAVQDAIGAVCAMSEEGRRGLALFLRSARRGSEESEGGEHAG